MQTVQNIPKVSILVPIYNVEKYLRQCLDSIVAQSLKDIEIICINDGSTDNSLQIIEEYAQKDNRIKIINKQNSGYGASMNKGLDAAIGEYIGIVESDDYIKENMFEALYNLANSKDLDIAKSDYYYYYSKDNISRHSGRIPLKNVGKIFSVKDDVDVLRIWPAIWSSVYKREFLKENNIRFLETPGASYQDTSFAFKTLACAKKVWFTNKAYLFYRQDNENSSINSKGKVYAICDEWNEIRRFLEERKDIKEIVSDVAYHIQFKAYRANVQRIAREFRAEFIDLYSDYFKSLFEQNKLNIKLFNKTDKKELKMLLNNKKAYSEYILNRELKNKQKANRKKLFSIRIGLTRISIILFGKQVIEIG